jgi:hypothetical protein
MLVTTKLMQRSIVFVECLEMGWSVLSFRV